MTLLTELSSPKSNLRQQVSVFLLVASFAPALALAAAAPGESMGDTLLEQKSTTVREKNLSRCDTSMILAGDTILTLPWSHVRDPAFFDIVAEFRAADVAIVNLETVIHTYQGYAQKDSGGMNLASPPVIADELAWAGVDMVAHANNHTFDYGSIAVLENLNFVTEAGIVLAGSGPDLQRARAPAYFVTPVQKIGLVSMASTFIQYGQASRTNTSLRGRPGLNPLKVIGGTEYVIPKWLVEFIQKVVRIFGYSGERFSEKTFQLAGFDIRVGDEFDRFSGRRALRKDLDANLQAISQAAAEADLVIASLHFHGDKPVHTAWLETFARQAIDAGADVFHNHGPHYVRGVEIYKGKPIFYGMGDFVFQAEHVTRLPAEAYERFGANDDLTPQEAIALGLSRKKSSLLRVRETFEGFVSSLCYQDRKLIDVRLIPVDLHFGDDPDTRGRPSYADQELGATIINDVAAASKDYDTQVFYNSADNSGRVTLPD